MRFLLFSLISLLVLPSSFLLASVSVSRILTSYRSNQARPATSMKHLAMWSHDHLSFIRLDSLLWPCLFTYYWLEWGAPTKSLSSHFHTPTLFPLFSFSPCLLCCSVSLCPLPLSFCLTQQTHGLCYKSILLQPLHGFPFNTCFVELFCGRHTYRGKINQRNESQIFY